MSAYLIEMFRNMALRVVVKQIAMVGGPKRFLKVRRAVLANHQQAVCEAASTLPTHSIKSLANRLGDGAREALARQRGEFPHQLARF